MKLSTYLKANQAQYAKNWRLGFIRDKYHGRLRDYLEYHKDRISAMNMDVDCDIGILDRYVYTHS